MREYSNGTYAQNRTKTLLAKLSDDTPGPVSVIISWVLCLTDKLKKTITKHSILALIKLSAIFSEYIWTILLSAVVYNFCRPGERAVRTGYDQY